MLRRLIQVAYGMFQSSYTKLGHGPGPERSLRTLPDRQVGRGYIYLAKSTPPPPLASRPPSPKPFQLNGLPAEILKHIAGYLPLSSAAALALSSRFILSKLGTTYFSELNNETLPELSGCFRTFGGLPQLSPSQQEKEDFLILLDRDQRDTIYCYYCRRIHYPANTANDRRKKWWDQGACTKIENIRFFHHYFHDNFVFSTLQSIVKKSEKWGVCSSELGKLSKSCTYYGQRFTHQMSTHVRIVEGSILVRVEHWLLVKGDGAFDPLRLPHRFGAEICPHANLTDFVVQTFGTSVYSRSLAAHSTSSSTRVTYSGLFQCQVCTTEFEIDSAPCEKGFFALRTAVWQDFGKCESPFDPKWEHHRNKNASNNIRSPWFRLGSIKGAFESVCCEKERLGTPVPPKGLCLSWILGKWYRGCRSSCGFDVPRSFMLERVAGGI